jgi:hypothetical protein
MQNRYADFFFANTNSIAARGFLLCYGSAVTFHDFYVGKGSGPFHGQTDSNITCKTATRIFFPVYTNSTAARRFLLCYGSAVTFHDFQVGKGSGPFHGQTDSYITCKTITRMFFFRVH